MEFIFIWIVSTISNLVRYVTTLTRPVSEWILDILYALVVGRTRRLPPINDRILLMPATELARKIRRRQLSAQEVMVAYIQRCKDIHPKINAQVDESFSDARREARSIDNMLSKTQLTLEELAADMPLLGVPFSCKESIGVRGLAQTNGIVRFRNRKAPNHSATAELYHDAGGIPYVVTNVPELGMWWEAANHVHGWTRNPYDNRRTVGGSSGGEASLITSCGALIGIGNDIAGSIRIPSSFCGIYGHKPSRGLISNEGYFPSSPGDPLDQFSSTGPMCRYVRDLKFLVKILCSNSDAVNWTPKVDFRNVKIFYMEEFPGWLLSATSDIKAAVRKAVQYFEEQYGVTAVKLELPEMKYAFYIWECKLLEAGGPSFRSQLEPNRRMSIAWEFFLSLFRLSVHTWPALYFAAVDRRTRDSFYEKCLQMYVELERKLEECLEGDSILLIPTHPDPPPHYLMTIPKYPNIGYTCIFSILGYPSTQIPTGMSRGLPIGIQAISTLNKDNLTLAAAEELDKVFGGWINPGPVADL